MTENRKKENMKIEKMLHKSPSYGVWLQILEGDLFSILCGVRQDVLSPVLFVLYIDGVISEPKLSSHGVHVGSLFIGCVLQGGPKK